MRIMVIEPDGTGGLAHFGFEIARCLAEEGHVVDLVSAEDFELREECRSFRLRAEMRLWHRTASPRPLHAVPRLIRRAWRGLILTREWLRVAAMARRERPDLVICSEILFPHLGLVLWWMRKGGLSLVQVCHEFAYQEREGSTAGSGLRRRLSRLVYAQFDWMLFLSDATRAEFLKRFDYPPQRALRIWHGGQTTFPPSTAAPGLKSRLGICDGEPVFLFFGGIRPSKGVSDLLAAFAAGAVSRNAKLVIAGRPVAVTDIEELRQQALRLGIADRVRFETRYIGREETADFFALASCVVLPYRSATQSGVLHLAYRMGRPVIATAVGGLVEDVRAGLSGLLVPPGDVQALAEALDEAARHPERLAKMGRAAADLDRVEFSWARTARLICSLVPPGPSSDDGVPVGSGPPRTCFSNLNG